MKWFLIRSLRAYFQNTLSARTKLWDQPSSERIRWRPWPCPRCSSEVTAIGQLFRSIAAGEVVSGGSPEETVISQVAVLKKWIGSCGQGDRSQIGQGPFQRKKFGLETRAMTILSRRQMESFRSIFVCGFPALLDKWRTATYFVPASGRNKYGGGKSQHAKRKD